MTYVGNDLFEEKSLGAIFLKSIFRLSHSIFNTITTICVIATLTFHAFFFGSDVATFIAIARTVTDVGLSFGSSILGFLIAGFTIFATLTKPALFIMMYENVHPKSKLNYLKHNFFAFTEVFTVYMVFLGLCILVKVLGATDGALLQSLIYASQHYNLDLMTAKIWIAKLAYITLGAFLYYSLVSLKSFVFNIYHIVITSIVWEMNSPAGKK